MKGVHTVHTDRPGSVAAPASLGLSANAETYEGLPAGPPASGVFTFSGQAVSLP